MFSRRKVEAEIKINDETWVWVDGYKGTDEDMVCSGYQYEFGRQHDIEEGVEIKECESGFHLCLKLSDVFHYYSIGRGNRFFKVRALVRLTDYSDYGSNKGEDLFTIMLNKRNKLVAKSIVFLRELTPDEILADTKAKGWSEQEKKMVLKEGFDYVYHYRDIQDLVLLGYSQELATYIVNCGRKEIASALASQSDISMDMKIFLILHDHTDQKRKVNVTIPDMSYLCKPAR